MHEPTSEPPLFRPPQGPTSRFRAWHERCTQQTLLDHGWDVPVTCATCGDRNVPEFKGWTPSQAIRVGKSPTVYADLACTQCGANVKKEAGVELVSLFENQPIDPRNKRILSLFLGGILFWLVTGMGLFGIMRTPLFGFFVVSLPMMALVPVMMGMNAKIQGLRRTCPCGTPAYKFMGMLGRSYCFRCSTCGRLMRLKD